MRSTEWLEHVSRAYSQAGQALSPTLRRSLLTPGAVSGDDPRFKQAFDLFTRYFFRMGAQGVLFGDVHKIKERFGYSLEENYRLSSGPFLNLAKAYWTFKIELDDIISENRDFPLTEILRSLEVNVASVFFPTPGPMRMPVSARATAQREMLEAYAPGIDIERFIAESPILRADSARERRGCFGVLVSLVAVLSSIAAIGIYLVLLVARN